MAWVQCGVRNESGVLCQEKRPSNVAMDEHIQAAHGGPKAVAGAVATPEVGDPPEALRGLEEAYRKGMEQATEMPMEDAAKLVADGSVEKPTISVREQHMMVGQTALPSKVRVFDAKGHERHVRPEIAIDRVLFKNWTWPKAGDPASGHRKTKQWPEPGGWFTWGPCGVCGRSDESDSSKGPEETLIRHQQVDHPTWWKTHEADEVKKTNAGIAEALQMLARAQVGSAEQPEAEPAGVKE